MKIVLCGDPDRERWNAFAAASPDASFYHRFEWMEINKRCFGHESAYLAAVDSDQIAGIFPIVRMRSPIFGNIACSMPFLNYGGPCADSDDVRQALIDEASNVIDRWGSDYLEIRSKRDLGGGLVTSQHKVSMTLALDPDSEKLWNAFKTGHRNEIRKGYKNNLTAKVGGAELIDDFYLVLSESWRDLGTPIYAKSFLQAVAAKFGEAVRLVVIYSGDEPAAAAFDGIHGDTIEGMWLGIRQKFRNQYAGYVLYWELIKNGCDRGHARFHLGRSTAQSSGETFKKKWNAETTQLYWHYKLRTIREIPEFNPSNPKYKLAINAWRKLPLRATQLIGPLIARSIP